MGLASATTGMASARGLVIVTVLTALGLTIYTVVTVQGAKFDIQAFGIGMAALLSGGGVMMNLNPATPTPPAIVPAK